MAFTLPQNSVLLLEGGAFRGVYTSGVLDVLMENNLYFPTVAGVSAGALNGVNYVSRQPGRAARINLRYRHDPRYVGPVALLKNHGLFGFDFMFEKLAEKEPFDAEAFASSEQKFYAVATDVNNGHALFFEKSTTEDFNAAVQASASMPVCSLPVAVGDRRCLDGGCSCAIPVEWALRKGFDKIVVVATRDKAFRKSLPSQRMVNLYTDFYSRHPAFLQDLLTMDLRYNRLLTRMEELEEAGRIFVIRPQKPVEVDRLEPDLDKLLALTNEGREEMQAAMPALQRYLEG